MPLILVALAAGGGGFILGRGADGVGTLVKWGVIGGGVYLVAKAKKVI